MPILQPPVYIHTASGKSRPQMDHYYPRDLYPYLAVSLYNLVPCCAVCNTAKGPLDTMKDPILYPYDEGFSYDMGFQIVAKDSDDWVKILHDGTGEFSLGVEKNSPNTARKGSCGRETDGCH